jgi:predicted RNA polymerase sigma factor
VTSQVNEPLARSLTPSVLGILVRRGADFAAAEDAVQDALVEAVRVWPADPPRDPKGWLVTVAWRRFLDATRADAARRRRCSSEVTLPSAMLNAANRPDSLTGRVRGRA